MINFRMKFWYRVRAFEVSHTHTPSKHEAPFTKIKVLSRRGLRVPCFRWADSHLHQDVDGG